MPIALPESDDYEKINSTYRGDKLSEGRAYQTEIGDEKSPDDFYPQMKVKLFGQDNNEVNFSARIASADGKTAPSLDGSKILWTNGDMTAEFYNTSEGYEFSVVLHNKPVSNVIDFTIRHKNLNFWYQPEVTQQEADDLGTTIEDIERPDNVVGSYAVYHSGKAFSVAGDSAQDYRNGKAFHIYRPWAEDAKGARVWCDLFIDPVLNIMTVTLPADFHANAVYPVLVDPTFGYSSVPPSNASLSSEAFAHNHSSLHLNSAPSSNEIQSYHWYSRVTSGSVSLDFAAYDMGAGNTVDGSTRLAAGVTITWSNTTAAWQTSATVAQALTSGNNYTLGCGDRSGTTGRQYYDTSGDNAQSRDSGGSLSATWNQTGTWGYTFGYYATYDTAGGGGLSIPIAAYHRRQFNRS